MIEATSCDKITLIEADRVKKVTPESVASGQGFPSRHQERRHVRGGAAGRIGLRHAGEERIDGGQRNLAADLSKSLIIVTG